MNQEKLKQALPMMSGWIDQVLAIHANTARSVVDFGFNRLPSFYSLQLLKSTKVVVLERLPVPPLTSMGFPEFSAFEHQQNDGITFKDTYFLREAVAQSESLHFHELVHVVQWAHLGVEKFLVAYANGLAANGYRNSPLEVMAYTAQEYFDKNAQFGFIEGAIKQKLNELYP